MATDLELLAKAEESRDWSDVKDIEDQVQDAEIKEKVRRIKIDLYRREERFAGCE